MLQVNQLIGFGVGSRAPQNISLIPTMTGATTSGVTFSASSEFVAANNFAYKAGDKNLTGAGGDKMWLSANGSQTGAWIKVDLGSALEVFTYKWTCDGGYHPVTGWTYEGSLNDAAWTTIDTKSGLTFSSVETKTYLLAAPVTYRYHRWTTTTNSANFATCVELDLLN